jgi:hypothetical protein
MKDSMKLTVAERNTLLELAHLLNEGLGDIAVMLAEPWLQDAPRNAPRMTALVRRRARPSRTMQCDPGIAGMTRERGIFGAHDGRAGRHKIDPSRFPNCSRFSGPRPDRSG